MKIINNPALAGLLLAWLKLWVVLLLKSNFKAALLAAALSALDRSVQTFWSAGYTAAGCG